MPAGNPLANLLVIVVGVLTIAMSVVVGFFAFVALAGFVLILAAYVGIRGWWLRRQAGAMNSSGSQPDAPAPVPKSVIEGEFKVVDDE